MREVNILVLGFGNVGQEFVRMVEKKRDRVEQDYEIKPVWLTVFRRETRWDIAKGYDILPLFKRDLSTLFHPLQTGKVKDDLQLCLQTASPGVLLDCSVSDPQTGKPGYEIWKSALEAGWHVVTASKGPLVYDFKGIQEAAQKKSCRLGISGAAAAALPTVDLACYALAGTEIRRIEGILNGTSNYVLTRMSEGQSYAEALKAAQGKGIAEPDPSMDVKGWDTAFKILIIANAVFGAAYNLEDMTVTGIDTLTLKELEEASKKGLRFKLLGRYEKMNEGEVLEVAPKALDPSHPLYQVSGSEKGISFETDTMGTITVIGGRSSPVGAAAALLKDLINICSST
ncbi:MAG TPA: homoserine dehydrogenase [Acidobacteriota bacterium]|nr:homoserine dehydrogenase [Acidobacteriota bacterium]